MEQAGVPLVPGYHGEAQDEAHRWREAPTSIGFPVLVKASAGGGGRGMRIVRAAGELAAALVSAKREAKAAFGDDRMLIEKFVEQPAPHRGAGHRRQPRQSAVAVRARMHAAAPAPEGDRGSAVADARRDARREAVCAAARKAAAAVDYVGAGTIEFVSDGNGRLLHRDEHPPAGRASRHRDDHRHRSGRMAVARRVRRKAAADAGQITLNGHAIEARVYAENPQAASCPRSAGSRPGACRRRATGCASMPASGRAMRFRRITTPCWPR